MHYTRMNELSSSWGKIWWGWWSVGWWCWSIDWLLDILSGSMVVVVKLFTLSLVSISPLELKMKKKFNICLCKVGSWGLVQLSVWYRSFDSRSRKGLRLIFCTESLNCLWDLAQNQEHFEYCNNPCTFRLNKLLFKDNILDLIKNKMKN